MLIYFSALYSREILTCAQLDKIESRPGIRERNLELLRTIPRRGPNAFAELLNSLKVSFDAKIELWAAYKEGEVQGGRL